MNSVQPPTTNKNKFRRINLSLPPSSPKPKSKSRGKNKSHSKLEDNKGTVSTKDIKQQPGIGNSIKLSKITKKGLHLRSKTESSSSIIHSMFPKIKKDYSDFIEAFKLFHKRRRSHHLLMDRYSNRIKSQLEDQCESMLQNNKQMNNVKLCHFQIKQYLDELCSFKRAELIKMKEKQATDAEISSENRVIPKKIDLNFQGKEMKRAPVVISKLALNDLQEKRRSMPLRICGIYKSLQKNERNSQEGQFGVIKSPKKYTFAVPDPDIIALSSTTLELSNKQPVSKMEEAIKRKQIRKKYKVYKDFPTSILKINKEKGYDRLSPWESVCSNFIQIEN